MGGRLWFSEYQYLEGIHDDSEVKSEYLNHCSFLPRLNKVYLQVGLHLLLLIVGRRSEHSPQKTLFNLGLHKSQCSRQRTAKSITQKLPLGKGLATWYQSVLRRLCNTWHLPSEGCRAFFWTFIYVYIPARANLFQ